MRALASLSRPTVFALLLSACDESTASDAAQSSEGPSRSWQPAALLPAFSAPALASFGDKVVLVGGDERWRTERALETWQFDGARWEQVHTRQAPSARQLPGLARFQDQLLMFGGKETSLTPDFADYVNETWTWNGADWTQLQLAQAPGGRSAPAITSWGGQILLFGGQSSSGALQDTWRWGGTQWTLLQPSDGPKDCASPAARLGATVVMFCSTAADQLGHTFVWDGVGWNERATSTKPSGRHGHVLASYGERVLMYGGDSTSGNTQETWEWDGSDWHERTSSPSPPMREGYQLTQLADKLVLHGGGESQTWMWDGERWSTATLPTMPAARRDYAIATLGERVIVFGGCCRADAGSRAQYWDDTWAWDGEHWSELQPAQRPAARASARLAAIGGKLVLFGGRGSDGLLADTWELDGGTWIERQVETHPAARQHHTMAAFRGAVVLLGGASSEPLTPDNALADMWQWDGSSWRQLVFSGGPKPGYRHALASYGEDLALFSGSFAELWFWNGETWTRRELGDDHTAIPESAVYMAQLGPRLVAGGLSDFGFGLRTREWDGMRWSEESFLAQSVGPVASVGETLVGLGGAPLRTWIYASH